MGVVLANGGFVVLQARYPGSWQSYGNFGPKSALKGAELGLELLASEEATDLGYLTEVQWSIDRLALVGSSFGGAVAIGGLARFSLADMAIAFCPFLDPPVQNTDTNQPEQDVGSLFGYLQRCHANVFRGMDKEEWFEFLNGRSPLYPPAYVETLCEKPLMLVHGHADTTVRAYHTVSFYESLLKCGAKDVRLILKDDIGHGRALRAATWDDWTRWLCEVRCSGDLC